MTQLASHLTPRERELGAIISAYNEVTERLKQSHDQLQLQVTRLRDELACKNEELRRRERLAALGEMAAGVAHEIRNPLGGIQVFASLLARDLEDRPREQQLAEKITRCVKALENIVADTLAFGRPSGPDPSPALLEQIVGEAVELAVSRFPDTRVRVEVGDGVAAVEMTTDSAMLQRAILNLLVNALEATVSAGNAIGSRVVRVDAHRIDGDRMAITIADQGPGIEPELANRIFNPFFTTKDEGTGLGLAIVHQIAETLGGSVRAQNSETGGAVFTLNLPVCLPAEQYASFRGRVKPEGDSTRAGLGKTGRDV